MHRERCFFEDCELALSHFGLRYSTAMLEIARGDRIFRPRAMASLPRGMKRIAPFARGSTNYQTIKSIGGAKSATILETSAWRIGLVRLDPAVTIPLHDHPGAYAVSYVIEGEVMIDAFSSQKECSRRTVQLRHAWSVKCAQGQSATLDPWDVNIHRIHASEVGAVLLTGAFANGAQLKTRRWFFPISQSEKGTLSAAVVDQPTVNNKIRPSGVYSG